MTADADARADARLREIEQEIFARRPEHVIEPSLDRIRALVALLGDPQHAYPVVHITGTNGKTSTARMTETLLRARGLRTGLFTSPHLSAVQERICVDGEPLSAERFIEAYQEILPYLQLVDESQGARLSFFEVLVGMAFAVFADAPVDVAVIEVGMGGTWDNTNVADGTVAIVTPISIDHARHLGGTVDAIAADKSGIIKPGARVVLGRQPAAAQEVLLQRAEDVGATVVSEGSQFGVTSRELAVGGQLLAIRGLLGDYSQLFLPLFGEYQASNAACALAAAEAFAGTVPTRTHGAAANGEPGTPALPDGVLALPLPGPLSSELVREAFSTMSSPGRLEIVRRNPVVIIDSAHNPAGMAASVGALTEVFADTQLVSIVAVSEDKDVAGILDQLEPAVAQLVVTGNSSPRSMDPVKLADLAGAVFGEDRITVAATLPEAIQAGLALTGQAAARSARDARSGPGGAGSGPGGAGSGPGGAGSGPARAGSGPGGAALLITGSVITAGDARLLLPPAAGRTDGQDPAQRAAQHTARDTARDTGQSAAAPPEPAGGDGA